jgi:sugar O-acyltransferase (sialic acid O-acetyltransferase NeuD family)
MKKIAIFGAGGFGREVAMLIEQINTASPEWTFVGFYDDGVKKGNIVNGMKVWGGMKELNEHNEELALVFAIGNPITKRKLHRLVNNRHVYYPSIIHPNVLVGDRQFVQIGNGCIICASTIITVNISIGNHVILNLGCTVGHDTTVQDYCSFMPSVNISGEVMVNEAVYAGTGVKIINQVEVGENSILGAGAVVSEDLPANCTAVGVPAKPIKFHEYA